MENLNIKHAIEFINSKGYNWDGKIVGKDTIPETIYDFDCPQIINLNSEEKGLILYNGQDDSPECIIYQIVNAERYKELLSSCPHRIIADLAVIYHVMFNVDSKDDIVSCLINNKHLKIWNIDENELFLKAMENTPKFFPIQCCSILDVIENASEERRNEKEDMLLGVPFVLRNQMQCNGAAVVLYPGVFEKMQKKFGNFFLLPSSVHEWIIIPKWCGTDVKYMSSTVQEVNDTKVHPMEYLSGNIYTRGKDELLGIVKVY